MQPPLAARIGLSLAGYALMGCAVVGLLGAGLGMDAYDVLTTGLAHVLHVSLSAAIVTAGVAFIAAAWVLGQRPGWGTPANSVCISITVFFATQVQPHNSAIAFRIVEYIASVVIFAIGISLVVRYRLGAGPPELVMLGLVQHHIHIRWARTGVEVFAAALGFILGGGFGFGTVIYSLVIGHLLAFFLHQLKFAERLPTKVPAGASVPGI